MPLCHRSIVRGPTSLECLQPDAAFHSIASACWAPEPALATSISQKWPCHESAENTACNDTLTLTLRCPDETLQMQQHDAGSLHEVFVLGSTRFAESAVQAGSLCIRYGKATWECICRHAACTQSHVLSHHAVSKRMNKWKSQGKVVITRYGKTKCAETG